MSVIYIGDKDVIALVPLMDGRPAKPRIVDRQGERRLLPAAVIRNAIQAFRSWQESVDAGIAAEIPPAVRSIPWACCLGIPESTPNVKLGKNPALNLIEQQGDAGA